MLVFILVFITLFSSQFSNHLDEKERKLVAFIVLIKIKYGRNFSVTYFCKDMRTFSSIQWE